MKPSSLLNPSAQEWRKTPHHHLSPPHAVVLAPQEVVWHLPPPQMPRHHTASLHYGFMPYYVPQAWTCDFVYYLSPPYSFQAARHFLGDEKKCTAHLEEIREAGVDKVEAPTVIGKRGAGLPPLVEWKPRKSGTAAASSRCGFSSRTTVMIKNIPNQLRRDFMLEFIDCYCKANSLEYDFFYLPMDFCSNDNLGYAFVNFISSEYALKFKEILHSYKWGDVQTDKGLYTSKKVCFLTWARIQGKEKLVERFKNTAFDCEDVDFLPVVFDPPRGGSDTTPAIVGRLRKQISNPTEDDN